MRLGTLVKDSTMNNKSPQHVASVPDTARNSALGPTPGGRRARRWVGFCWRPDEICDADDGDGIDAPPAPAHADIDGGVD